MVTKKNRNREDRGESSVTDGFLVRNVVYCVVVIICLSEVEKWMDHLTVNYGTNT